MLKRSLLAAAILLAAGTVRPAAAAPVLFEPYGNLFGARTLIASPTDPRPKDARQAQALPRPEAYDQLGAMALVRSSELPRGNMDLLQMGAGVSYSNVRNPSHPWQVTAFASNMNIEGAGVDTDEINWGLTAKMVLWQSEDLRHPVISGVIRYDRVESIQDRWDFALAADQRLADTLYGTLNLGFGTSDVDRGGADSQGDFVWGAGLTWQPVRQFSLSYSYVFDNDVDGEDEWNVAAIYAFDRISSLQLGAGKHQTIFANFLAKFN